MVSPDKSEHARKLSSYLSSSQRARLYGITETVVSATAIGVAGWSMANVDISTMNDLEGLGFIVATTMAASLGLLGVVDGYLTQHRASAEVAGVLQTATNRNFRIRGFFLNRTVEA